MGAASVTVAVVAAASSSGATTDEASATAAAFAAHPIALSRLPDSSVCADAPSTNSSRFYPGPSASYVYDETFRQSFAIPFLSTHTPQGMVVWPDWDGLHHKLLLIGMYRLGSPSYLVALDPDTGLPYATVTTEESHFGGLAVVGDWLIAQDRPRRGPERVRRYRLADLAVAFQKAHLTGTQPFVPHSADLQEIYGASFLATHDGYLWAGHYNANGPDRMFQYAVSSTGVLTPVGQAYEVPAQTQGLLVTDDRFVFESSLGTRSGTMTVVERSPSISPLGRCFATPSMGESLAVLDDRVLVVYESGSALYPKAQNRVTNLHIAPYAALSALTNQAPPASTFSEPHKDQPSAGSHLE
ncbi:MAG TPA: hypothetical protein VGJ14_13350 [Sporichthyaceae bacterium]|jgi:hypothetical protein